jgi:hypothetical protein
MEIHPLFVDQILGPIIISIVLFSVVLINFIVRGTYNSSILRMIAFLLSMIFIQYANCKYFFFATPFRAKADLLSRNREGKTIPNVMAAAFALKST